MKISLSIQTFCVLFVITCNVLEIYGKGGSRGGSSGSRGSSGGRGGGSSGRGGYSRGSSGSRGRSGYGSLSGGTYRSFNSGGHGSPNRNIYASISSGKNSLRSRSYGGSAGLVRNNTDDSREVQIHEANKAVVTERSTTKAWRTTKAWKFDSYWPKTTTYSPSLDWYPSLTTDKPIGNWNWRTNTRRIDEPPHPFQKELDKLNEMHKEIERVQSMSLEDLARDNDRRSRF